LLHETELGSSPSARDVIGELIGASGIHSLTIGQVNE
jgi:hypothetical protein